jgi:hypothetical protein
MSSQYNKSIKLEESDLIKEYVEINDQTIVPIKEFIYSERKKILYDYSGILDISGLQGTQGHLDIYSELKSHQHIYFFRIKKDNMILMYVTVLLDEHEDKSIVMGISQTIDYAVSKYYFPNLSILLWKYVASVINIIHVNVTCLMTAPVSIMRKILLKNISKDHILQIGDETSIDLIKSKLNLDYIKPIIFKRSDLENMEIYNLSMYFKLSCYVDCFIFISLKGLL